MPVNVLCMKWGTKYDESYVNKLYRMVKRHLTLPFRFVCLTDNPKGIEEGIEIFPIPDIKTFSIERKNFFSKPIRDGAWKKLLTFSSPLYDLTGTALFLDLDLVIVDNIDDFFFPKGDFFIIKDWLKPDVTGNSSVYRFEIGKHSEIIDRYIAEEDKIRGLFRNEQEYLTAYMKEKGILAYWDDDLVKSFKRHCLFPGIQSWFRTPRLPEKARIIAFHGYPNPDQALEGNGGKWFRHIRPAKWVAEHWK